MTKTMKFEEAVARLEAIVEQMESGEVDLDRSLALFEEGVKLVHYCTAKLEEAKKKVEVLVKKGDTMVKEPFNEQTEKENSGNSDAE
jgi:exodeoxyribonuclease VII small subunit